MKVSSLHAILVFHMAVTLKGCFCEYYGKFIGNIQTKSNGFSGKVYAVDDTRIFITDMNFDGYLIEARFCVGTGKDGPSRSAHLISDEDGKSDKLQNYTNSRVLLQLPEKITSYGYIGICQLGFEEILDKSIGHVLIPETFQLPAEQNLGALNGSSNDVSATEIILKDSAIMQLREFTYDGNGADTHFAVGPSSDGPADKLTKLPDEGGRHENLKAYSKRSVTLKLPDGHHWNEYQWFTVFSFQNGKSFASLEIKQEVATVLPVHNPTSKVIKAETTVPLYLWLIVVVCAFVPWCCCCCCCAALVVYLRRRYATQPGDGSNIHPEAQNPPSAQWPQGQPANAWYAAIGAENPAAAQGAQGKPAGSFYGPPGAQNPAAAQGQISKSE